MRDNTYMQQTTFENWQKVKLLVMTSICHNNFNCLLKLCFHLKRLLVETGTYQYVPGGELTPKLSATVEYCIWERVKRKKISG